MTDELILTNSEVQDFMDCPRRWYLSVYRRLGKKNALWYNTATSIGSVYHAGLAAYYGHQQNPVEWAKHYYAEELVKIGGLPESEAGMHLNAFEKERQLVLTMLEGYMLYLEDEAPDEDLEVLGAEERIEVPLVGGNGEGGPITLRGKIDAPARWKSSPEILLQLEHKTVGNFTDLPKYAQVNPQFLTYDLMAYLRAMLLGEG